MSNFCWLLYYVKKWFKSFLEAFFFAKYSEIGKNNDKTVHRQSEKLMYHYRKIMSDLTERISQTMITGSERVHPDAAKII